MSSLSIGRAWDEAKAALQANRKLIVPVALGLVLLPAVIVSMVEPQVPPGEQPPAEEAPVQTGRTMSSATRPAEPAAPKPAAATAPSPRPAGDVKVSPKARRLAAWERLARDLDPALLEVIGQEIGLGEAIEAASGLIDGKVRGRIIVDVNR